MMSEEKRKADRQGSERAAARYSSLDKPQLEELARTAIMTHRSLLATDQAVYEEWVRASEDPLTTSSVLQTLQDEHMARKKKSEAQQNELSDILDALGYVPDVGAVETRG